jgi:hypothetical protein
MGEVKEFLQRAFNRENCFDARISTLQRFMEGYLSHPDFNADISGSHSIDHRVLEYFRVFKNFQILKFIRERGLCYIEFNHWVSMYGAEGIAAADLGGAIDRAGVHITAEQAAPINARLQEFYTHHFRSQDFETYLNDHPLRSLVEVWDARQRRNVLKPQGAPLRQQGVYDENQRNIPGWEPILRRNHMWPDAWN